MKLLSVLFCILVSAQAIAERTPVPRDDFANLLDDESSGGVAVEEPIIQTGPATPEIMNEATKLEKDSTTKFTVHARYVKLIHHRKKGTPHFAKKHKKGRTHLATKKTHKKQQLG